MGTSAKHGRVSAERAVIPDDEPVFVLRASDALAVDTLSAYLRLALRHTGMDGDHITAVTHTRNVFERWQAANEDQVKTPDTDLSQFDLG